MITKALLAATLLTAGSYGATELIEEIQPIAEKVAVTVTLEAVLRNAQYLEMLGMSRDEAFATSVAETPDADGLAVVDGKIRYEVLGTCGLAYFGDQYEKIVEPC
jgi:hypothetical protein